MQYKYLFQPIQIGRLELKNRIVMPAIHHAYTPDGFVNRRLVRYYATRAAGGAGLIIVGGCAIDRLGPGPMMISLQDDKFIPGLSELTAAVHAAGAKIAAQLYQSGRYAHSMVIGQQPAAPSAVASRFTGETPREMTREDIAAVIESYAAAADRAKRAGFDAVEVIASAGYLICQFLSPLTNLRTDEYGGSWENRCRFGIEVVRAIKERVGADYPLLVRISGNDFMPGSNTNKEAAAFARELEKAGVDCINVTGGWHETRVPQITGELPPGGFSYLAAGVKRAVSIPVIASNRINDPRLAEQLLCMGVADLVNMGRPLIADPDLPRKVQEGREREVRKCIACNQGCMDRVFSMRDVLCAVNGLAGREHELEVQPAQVSKNVLVIGGGPAGMEVAALAAERGHRVTLWEKSHRLGGQVHYAAKPPGKADFASLIEYQAHRLYKAGVEVFLNRAATVEDVLAAAPDVVVVATGARPIPAPFPVAEGICVHQANDVLDGAVCAGRRVVVVGGGAVGCETAIFLAEQGTISAETLKFLVVHQAEEPVVLQQLLNQSVREVTIVEMLKGIGRDIGLSTRWGVMKQIKRLGIKVLDQSKVVGVLPEGVLVETPEKQVTLPADTVVLALGARSENSLYEGLQGRVKELYLIGDAVKPRKITEAIAEACELGIKL